MRISYETTPRDWYGDFVRFVEATIERTGANRICEIGGGANPALSPQVVAGRKLDYLIVDVSSDELRKAPAGYQLIEADVASTSFVPPGEFDLVFSVSVCEHIQDPLTFHRNTRSLLGPAGLAIHSFSTLFALPFVLNRMLPDAATDRLLGLARPGREPSGKHGKFPALYRWCRGPSRRQIARLESAGFAVEEYVGSFGHFYLRSVPRAQAVENRIAAWLVNHPHPALTSYARVTLSAR